MQHRYVGDIGDLGKYALLRAISSGRKLAVAWYLYPDEDHNADGKHISYLTKPSQWRHLDEATFDAMGAIIKNGTRHLDAVEQSGILGDTKFFTRELKTDEPDRKAWRKNWFSEITDNLHDIDIVFADPDNGLRDDEKALSGRKGAWKGIPLSEVEELARGRCAVIYHHNTRRKGGHSAENEYWLYRLGQMSTVTGACAAIRFRSGSSRTYFILNADERMIADLEQFSSKWGTEILSAHPE